VTAPFMLGILVGFAGGYWLCSIHAKGIIKDELERMRMIVEQAEQIVKEKSWEKWP
jgi:hypothetical protein